MKTTIQQPTYVLFGKRAIERYKMSLNALINSKNLKYNVGIYTNVTTFIIDKNCWNDFTVISEKEYTLLNEHINENKNEFNFIPFFDTRRKSFAYQLN